MREGRKKRLTTLPGSSSTNCLRVSTFGLAAARLNRPTIDSPGDTHKKGQYM